MPTTKETLGTYTLEVELDAQGRLVAAKAGPWRLTVDPDAPRATLRGVDGSETWERGRANGTWLDLPYGHENDVDVAISLPTWVEQQLRTMRGMVFICGPGEQIPTGALAVETIEYALRHGLLSPRLSDPYARDTLRHAMAVATADQRKAWRAAFVAGKLTDYIEILDQDTQPRTKRR